MASADVATPTTNGAPTEDLAKLDIVQGEKIEQTHKVTDSLKTPFPQPLPSSKPKPAATLTPDQVSKYKSLLETAQAWTSVPDILKADAPSSPITDSERIWLTRDCLLRYLRASKWVLPTAQKRLLATLSWRREWGLESHTADYISEENATGKQVITGYDNESRPCLYLNAHKQNTKETPRQMHHLVYMMERCIDLMPAGQEQVSWLIDYKNMRSSQHASVDQGRQTIYILQNHYPERLGKAFVQNLPWAFKLFYKLMMPFIDPVTKEKMSFDVDLRTMIPPEQMVSEYGGDAQFVYEHEVYWPALNELAERRRKEKWERWEKAGKKVGESELYLKGVGEPVADTVEEKPVEKVVEGKEDAVAAS